MYPHDVVITATTTNYKTMAKKHVSALSYFLYIPLCLASNLAVFKNSI